eukprot:6229409-Pyramimonas_sp.AAC.1
MGDHALPLMLMPPAHGRALNKLTKNPTIRRSECRNCEHRLRVKPLWGHDPREESAALTRGRHANPGNF